MSEGAIEPNFDALARIDQWVEDNRVHCAGSGEAILDEWARMRGYGDIEHNDYISMPDGEVCSFFDAVRADLGLRWGEADALLRNPDASVDDVHTAIAGIFTVNHRKYTPPIRDGEPVVVRRRRSRFPNYKVGVATQ